MAVTLHVVQSNIRFVENFTLIFVAFFWYVVIYAGFKYIYARVYV